MTSKQVTSTTADREVSSSRLFAAPRELVWKVWTEPEHVAQWWGPNGFTSTIHEMAVRPGGVWRLTMHGPDGVDYPNHIVFKEVVPPERLVYTHGSGIDDDPYQFVVTVLFESVGAQTRLSMRAVFKTAAARNEICEKYGAIEGMHQHLARLGAYLTTTTSNR